MRSLPLLSIAVMLSAAPPVARRAGQVDDYHGVKVADPYRWLEDTDAPETRGWIEGQNRHTRQFLDAAPRREEARARLRELYQFERFLSWREKAGRVFYRLQGANQNQSILYLQNKGKDRVLVDPNQIDPAGLTAMGNYSVSRDGRYLAYSMSKAGSDWQTWHVLEVDTGKALPDLLEWTKFSEAVWDTTGAGFYYGRYPKPEGGLLTAQNVNYRIYYHRLRTPQSSDRLIYERPDQPHWSFNPRLSQDGRYLVVIVEDGTSTKNRVEYIQLTGSPAKPVSLIGEFYAAFDYLGHKGDVFYFSTTYNAPRGRVVAIDLMRPARDQWRQVVAETGDTLAQAQFVKGTFVLNYLHDVAGKVVLRQEDGSRPREVPLPARSAIGLAEDSSTVFHVSGFTQPGLYYRCGAAACLPVRPLRLSFDPEQYESRQIFYLSRDGTKIPMFLVSRKGAATGPRPTLLYAYGGFNISTTPSFSPLRLAWMERGGLLAVANLRGGGEYGEEWHQAGMRDRKQNVFDDFIAAGEYLVNNGLTTRDRLAISGGSNGGLLVGAVANQRPDLFAAAVPSVGVMDMLRFHQFTVGRGWTPEYGSPDNAEDFHVLAKYSPLHNIRAGVHYPATLVLTGDHDDRVVPGHSFKYAAALQAAQSGDAPVLIRIETSAGHGGGKPVSKQIDEGADVLAFLARVLVQ